MTVDSDLDLLHGSKLSSVVRYDYRLDARGNWVHRSLQRPRLPHTHEEMVETADRLIEYYD